MRWYRSNCRIQSSWLLRLTMAGPSGTNIILYIQVGPQSLCDDAHHVRLTTITQLDNSLDTFGYSIDENDFRYTFAAFRILHCCHPLAMHHHPHVDASGELPGDSIEEYCFAWLQSWWPSNERKIVLLDHNHDWSSTESRATVCSSLVENGEKMMASLFHFGQVRY